MTETAGRAFRPLIVVLAALLAMAMTMTLAPAAEAQETTGIPVTGTLEDGGTFTGTLSDLQATRVGQQIELSGILSGTATDAAGNVTEIVDQAFAVLLGADQIDGEQDRRECRILFLELGPIFLDLLGLEVTLDQVVLDITAVPGPGNLLGNLLCAVAGLLDGPGNPLGAITNLLNRIFGLLG
jgi:hypothetical protein